MFKVFLVKKNKRLYVEVSVLEKRILEYDVVLVYYELDSVVFFIVFVVLDIMYLLMVNLDKVLVLILLSLLFILMGIVNGSFLSSVFKFFKVEKEKENLLVKKFKFNLLLLVESCDKNNRSKDNIGGCEVFNE